MRVHFTTIPVFDPEAAQAELNGFLARHRVLAVDRQLVSEQGASAWAVCVSYLEGAAEARPEAPRVGGAPRAGGAPRVDYKAALSEADFAYFAELREVRKAVAAEHGVPVYSGLDRAEPVRIVRKPRAKHGRPDLEPRLESART